MQHPDQIYGYSTVILAAAPLASQLAIADIRWVFFFPIFALPALTLMMTVGHLSKSAPVQTFRKMVPLAAGVGWALTWHVAEKLYSESLRAAQLFLYILFSFRPSLSWAVSCSHTYNTEYCHDFLDPNITVTESKHHYPDNFWPAQEFNRYVFRNNDPITSVPAHWQPNMWYLGNEEDVFAWAFPSIPLVIAHVLTWTIIYLALTKYYDRLGDILLRFFLMAPLMMYMAVIIGLTGFGFHFTSASVVKAADTGEQLVRKELLDFWADLKGYFRTSILIVDYSTAFTGFVLLATSRLRSGVNGLSAWILVPFMMLVPTMQTIIRLGCEGHVADAQPDYHIYATTDETIAFDLLPVCFASTSFGPVWSTLFYTAHYLYTSLGPMLVFVTFIYQSFIDDFPIVQNNPKQCIGMIALAFFLPSMFLYMPMGTKIASFFRYTSQTAFVQMAVYILVFFVYGWQRLERDVIMTSEVPTRPSIIEYFTRPTSPIFTVLLFTVVPMLICTKFVAVFDFMKKNSDITDHIKMGTQFLPFPSLIRQIAGYLMMFAPLIIMLVGAAITIYQMMFKHGLTWTETIRPSPEWMSHAAVNQNKPKPHSLAYSIMSRLVFRKFSYRSAICSLFVFETFIGIFLTALFFLNSAPFLNSNTSQLANQYRSVLLLILVAVQIFSLFEIRKCLNFGDIQSWRLSMYIGQATVQTAVVNGYMWMFAEDHMWGTDWPPIVIIICTLIIRGSCIITAIAIRAHSLSQIRPSNTREASEIDDAELARGRNVENGEGVGPAVGGDEDDDDDDSPVIFDLARA
ncbi:unnamed protein product [Caenorhabditis brenneri]